LSKGTAPIITLHRPVLLIGRHLECDVWIDHVKISRRHCCLAIAYDRVLVRDLGSRNSVRVNGQVVEEARLKHGDELALGPIIYRLELLEEKPEDAAPQPGSPTSQSVGGRGKSPVAGVAAAAGKPRVPTDSDWELVPLDDN
jgi:pSer/pThr/pTyr-binding forkhead associated (FHA) protein